MLRNPSKFYKIKNLNISLFLLLTISAFGQSFDFDDDNIIFLNDKGFVISKDSLSKLIGNGSSVFNMKSDTTLPSGVRQITISIMSNKINSDSFSHDEVEFINRWKGRMFPEFTLSNMMDESISNEQFYGKILVFNFWFTGCKPCLQEMPELNNLVKKFHDMDVTFLAPSFNTKEQLSSFLIQNEFDYIVLAESKPLNHVFEMSIYPTHMIVDKSGIIREIVIGFTEDIQQTLTNAIQNILLK